MSDATLDHRLPFEPKGRDFPYYNGQPARISLGGWLLILVAVAVGFAVLGTPLGFEDNRVTGWLRVIAFVGLPLIALKMAAPRDWTAIFDKVGFREIRLMVGFALLNILVSGAIGVLVKVFGTVASNAAIASAADLDGGGVVNFFAKVGVQLLGEELLTILPFLALLSLFHARFGMSRKSAVIIAWLSSAVLFGLLHLPTYNWSLVQCLLVIGGARLVLTWAYIYSKNIWVSTGAHIINDWTLIATTVFLAPLAT